MGFSLLRQQSILEHEGLGGADERGLPYLAVQLRVLRSPLGLRELDRLYRFWLHFFLLRNVSTWSCMPVDALYISK